MLLLLEEIDLIFANTSFGSCILLLFNKYKIYFEGTGLFQLISTSSSRISSNL